VESRRRALHNGRLRELIRSGKIQPAEAWLQLRDIETGAPVEAGGGSVCWNEFRRRWVLLAPGQAGEVWFSLGDTPTGLGLCAPRRHHGRYNFYNPTQHPFFDQEHGRLIYFEAPTPTPSPRAGQNPRYNYNNHVSAGAR